MSFEFTDHERLRVVAASLIGLKLDHIGYIDLGVIVFWGSIYGIHLGLVIYILRNQRYLPLRDRGIVSVVAIYIAGIVWYIGDILTNEMVHPTSKLLRNCVFTCVWMRSILGQMMVYGFLAVHCTGLRFKYDGRHKIRFNGLARYSLTAIVVLANLLVGIIITIVPKPMTITFFDGLDVCMFQDTFKNAVMVLSWATLGITIGVCVYLNFSVKCRHHEGTDLLVACFALAMASAFQTAVFYVKPRYPVNLGWRVAVVSLDQISLFVTWWAVVGRALYNCMVRKEAYLIDWSDKDPPT